jgi:hypothetical protein
MAGSGAPGAALEGVDAPGEAVGAEVVGDGAVSGVAGSEEGEPQPVAIATTPIIRNVNVDTRTRLDIIDIVATGNGSPKLLVSLP